MTTLQAIILGALQGITELFPISSLGHTVILPQVLQWSIDQSEQSFVLFIVATHVATALVLLAYFQKDWIRIFQGFIRSVFALRVPAGDTYARLAWLLIVATVPAGLLGLLFQKKFEALFDKPTIAALFLIGNGILLYGAERLRRKTVYMGGTNLSVNAGITRLSYVQALGIGSAQALALFPGISRTGSSLAGGLLARLNHEEAAHFAFLLATPLIFAAGALKLPKLLHAGLYPTGTILLGSLISALMALLSVSFLSSYFKTKTLMPFAVYCVVAGILALALI